MQFRVVVVGWLGLFHQPLWPRTYIDSVGLTPFKIYMEILIVVILLIAGYGFIKHKDVFSLQVASYLFSTVFVTILSELYFVSFSHTHDYFYLLGHIYKIIAYFYLYKAVFISSVKEPFEQSRALQVELESSKRTLQSIIDNVPVRIFWKDRKFRYLGANKLFVEDAGAASIEELLGKSDKEYFPNHRDLYTTDDEDIMATGNAKLNYEEPLRTASGTNLWIQTSKVPLSDHKKNIVGVLGTYTDITERKLAEHTIAFQAQYDSLTKLPNRRLFYDRLEQQIKQSNRFGTKLGLLLLDLDNFKEINDSLGHSAGDELLCEIAQRLQDCIRKTDTVARLGGDEFIIILGDGGNNMNIERVAEKILSKLSEPIKLQDQLLYITVSIGIAIYPDDTQSPEDLLKYIDQAMYAAKLEGRNQYKYFDKSMQLDAQKRISITQELRIAIAEEQFSLAYQPIVNIETGRVTKAEALIRWNHPVRGLISPLEFIPIAETSGLILEIGNWVFYEASRQCEAWRRIVSSDFEISLNKSPVQFTHRNFSIDSWFEHLEKLGLPGKCISIEITEGLLLEARTEVQKMLMLYQKRGFKISLDDFGTGYSSLAYIKKFDIDYIKIDRTFVNSICINADGLALCEAIIEMAHKLGLEVIAEGVETTNQHEALVRAGCNYAQGYFYSAPISAGDFETKYKANTDSVFTNFR